MISAPTPGEESAGAGLEKAARELRDRLPFLARTTAFNHAGVSPQPRFDSVAAFEKARAERAPDEALHTLAGLPGRIRALYAALFGVHEDEIAVTSNTAEGVNIVAQGFPWKDGDEILTVDVEYPSNVYPWWNLCDRGVAVKSVPERDGRVDLDEFLAAATPATRLIAVSHVEFASGFRFDLAALARFCHERGIFLFVDVAQSAGALPVALSEVDAAAWPTWKWLMGPLGMGGFYLSRRYLEAIKPSFVGSDGMRPGRDYLDYRFDFKPGAARFEYSTANALGLAGTRESLEFFAPLAAPGPALRLEERLFAYADRVAALMEAAGFRLYSSMRPGERSGILSFVAPGEPEAWRARLRERGVETSVRGGRLRVAPHFYNDESDLARLEEALKP